MTISRTARRTAAVLAGSTALALSLGGCYELMIGNGNGAGNCTGGGFTIDATQNVPGSELTITYTGPAEAKLAYTEAFYSDDSFAGLTAGRAVTMDEGNVKFAVFDPTTDAGWTVSGSGATTTYEFVGSATDLIAGRETSLSTIDGGGMQYYDFLPGIIVVNCDGTINSDPLSNTTVINDVNFLDAPWIEAAAPVFPNHVVIEPFEIVTQTPIDGGIEGTLRFPAGTAERLGDFTPTGLATATLYLDNTDISNDNFSNLWFEALMATGGNAPSLTLDGSMPLNEDIPFTLVGGNSEELADGDYNALFIIGGTDGDRDSAKVVFMTMRYSAEGGLTITDVTEVVDPEEEGEGGSEEEGEGEVAELASTGIDAGAAAVAAGILALAGIGLIVARRRTSRL